MYLNHPQDETQDQFFKRSKAGSNKVFLLLVESYFDPLIFHFCCTFSVINEFCFVFPILRFLCRLGIYENIFLY